MGVVHHTHYLTWFEVGRTELMRGRGRSYAGMEREGIFMPVVEAHCRYHAPARYDEEVEIETVVSAASRIKVEFSYKVIRPSDGRLLATGRTVHVATDAAGSPRRISASLVADLGARAAQRASTAEDRGGHLRAASRRLVAALLSASVLLAAGCKKDLDKIPRDRDAGLAPVQLYEKGITLSRKGRYYRAREILEKVLSRQNVSPEILADTNLAIADAYYSDGGVVNVAEALSRYTSFLTFYPNHPRADYAQFQLGLCYLKQTLSPTKDQSTTRQALDSFRKVETTYPQSDFAIAAREKADVCRERLAEADVQVGIFYMKRKAYAGAIDRFRTVLEAYPRYRGRDQVYFLLGEALKSTRKNPEALLYYQKLVDEFPKSRYAGEARHALASEDGGSGKTAEAPKGKKSSSRKEPEPTVQHVGG